ncbi:endonuclease [Bacillus sp. Y1]|nr:thermonuclease family protein [Bacillus sp. Y1]AYA76020.1 endonuclease [Bacillus sp. Y1]
MMKRLAGGLIITAGTLLTIYSSPPQKKEIIQEVILQEYENQDSHLLKAEPVGNQVSVTLIEVIDGDTIKVRFNGKVETIRYLLINTPESKNPNMCVQPYAKEAYLRNSELVKSGKLTLEFEQGNTRDSYGRLLAYVFVDGESIQEKLLKEGYARVAYIINPPYKYLELFREDENIAKSENINVWARDNFIRELGFSGCIP